MALAVKQDETLDPTHIGFFGAQAIVSGTNGGADLLQEFGGLGLARQHGGLLVETQEDDERIY